MLKRKTRTLAVSGITIVVAALLTLSATAASAATATASAPGHVTAPQAAAASGCVTQTFGIWDENTYERCVRDEQVLLNDLWYDHVPGPNQLLTVDGHYGPHTTSDVKSFQTQYVLQIDGITGPVTWRMLCEVDEYYKFTGVYWYDAGCASIT
jgi:zinc D-Ala-D-Ala carboxypeptidase